MKSSQSLFSATLSSKILFLVVLIASLFFLIDTSISYVADFLVDFNTSSIGLSLFSAIALVYAFGQLYLLKYLNQQIAPIRLRSKFVRNLFTFLKLVQYSLIVNLALVLIQILISANYLIVSLTYATLVSNASSAILFGIFSLRFILWFRASRKSFVMLLYGLAFAFLSLSEFMVSSSDTYLLTQKDFFTTAYSEVKFYDFPEGTFFGSFYDLYNYVDISAFILMLSATAILLYQYSTNFRIIKLVVLIGLPLLSYMSGYLDTLNIYDTDTNPDLFSYYIFQALSDTSAGILFGLSIWIVVRHLQQISIKNFMIITAYGFVLFYITNSASVTVSPYPPFGLPSLSFLPFASALILIGIFSATVSLSQNITLRKSIRNILSEQRSLLLELGDAERDMKLKKMVESVMDRIAEQENSIEAESGIKSSLDTKEIQQYIHKVIAETKKTKEGIK